MDDEVEGCVGVSVSMAVLPEAAALLLVHPSSSYIFPVDESYFMFWQQSSSFSDNFGSRSEKEGTRKFQIFLL